MGTVTYDFAHLNRGQEEEEEEDKEEEETTKFAKSCENFWDC